MLALNIWYRTIDNILHNFTADIVSVTAADIVSVIQSDST